MLGFNMFAYCRNNPVCRKDATGTDDLTVTDANDDDNPLNDAGVVFRPGGAGASGGGGNTVQSQTSTNYSSAESFLKSKGANPQKVMSCFKGTPEVQTLQADTTVYRSWGGGTQKLGHWVSPYNYGANARSLLSLPPRNTMEYTSTFIIPRGTQVLVGEAEALFGQLGGGMQWWVSEVY